MYNLFDMGSHWELRTAEGTISGTFVQVITTAILKFGFDADELEFAVGQMVKYDHNAIHFGFYRSLIYTFKQGEVDVVKAS